MDPQLKQNFFKRTREQNVALGLNPDSAQDYREASETNFTALIAPERPFGAAEKQSDHAVNESDTLSTSDIQSVIEKKTEDIRLGRQEVRNFVNKKCSSINSHLYINYCTFSLGYFHTRFLSQLSPGW